MLEKNSKILYFDAHFHQSVCKNLNCYDSNDQIYGCSCAHSLQEYEIQGSDRKIVHSYGMHPQSAEFIDFEQNRAFLEELLKKDKIQAIGEAGFDYFTAEYKNQAERQEQLFTAQLELAIKYHKPFVIHCRKANEKLFQYSKQLKQLPAVLFHSFMGTEIEAKSLIEKIPNSYFSFGKQIFNNNKKVLACVKNLPIEHLLLETDAPFQTLKNEDKTFSSEIIRVYKGAFELRNNNSAELNKKSYEEFCNQLHKNFHSLFQIKD